MRVVIGIGVLALIVVSFLVGHAYSEQRLGRALAEFQRSCNLSVAETALRALDVIESTKSEQAKQGLILVAKSSIGDLTPNLIRPGGFLPSLGPDEATAFLRQHNDERHAALQTRLENSR